MTSARTTSTRSRAASGRLASLVVTLLLVCYAAYAAAFIYRTSFHLGGERYFCLFDDAMISMRYARNLAEGHGLVWNPGGERVQGFTSPLWTLYMSLWHLLPIPERLMSLPIQITSGLCVLLLLLSLRRLALRISSGSQVAGISVVALTAFYLPLNNWALQGMEVGLLALLLAAAVSTSNLISPDERARFTGVPYLLLGAACLVRLDAAPWLAAYTAFALLADREHRRRHLAWGMGTLAFSTGAQIAFSLAYYADPLPNTYYLKMTGYPVGLRVLRGWIYFLRFLRHAPWWMLALGALPAFRRRSRGKSLLLTLFLVQCAYSVYVGGDAWEWWGGANRYIATAMPLLFALLAVGLAEVVSWADRGLRDAGGVLAVSVRPAAVALLVALVVAGNRFGPTSAAEWTFAAPPMYREQNAENVAIARIIRSATTDRALVAVGWAGATPYFVHRRCHDLLGRCDRHIARQTARIPTTRRALLRFVPGHAKWDFDYSVLHLRPDLVLYDVSRGRREDELLARYAPIELPWRRIYARRGSREVNMRVLYSAARDPRSVLRPEAPPS